MTVLKTPRLILRAPRMEDAVDLHDVFSDPRAMAYWSEPPFKDLSQTEAFIAAMRGGDPAETVEFVIERDGVAIGKAGFWRVPEVGFILHPDHWGQGIGTEVLHGLLNHGFDDLGLERVIADVDPRNAASLALLAKLGFVETGREARTIEVAGVWCDSVYLRLTAADWAAVRAG